MAKHPRPSDVPRGERRAVRDQAKINRAERGGVAGILKGHARSEKQEPGDDRDIK